MFFREIFPCTLPHLYQIRTGHLHLIQFCQLNELIMQRLRHCQSVSLHVVIEQKCLEALIRLRPVAPLVVTVDDIHPMFVALKSLAQRLYLCTVSCLSDDVHPSLNYSRHRPEGLFVN